MGGANQPRRGTQQLPNVSLRGVSGLRSALTKRVKQAEGAVPGTPASVVRRRTFASER